MFPEPRSVADHMPMSPVVSASAIGVDALVDCSNITLATAAKISGNTTDTTRYSRLRISCSISSHQARPRNRSVRAARAAGERGVSRSTATCGPCPVATALTSASRR